ncbi:recombination regulator RecX [Rahnella sikkimica]|uniref:Regulatory protein RecX n=1 Tax=Rahnella sikkimica TaxID=1805933 RepID=A0A2L1UX61_9GAMM|nr:recombination regulator RecX [Rahnella sikkimica]AVF37515.1 recombination regulator RecX [Rahnella sikkimica]
MNTLISRAMRLLSQRDHGEAELRRKLLIPPVPFVKPQNKQSRWPSRKRPDDNAFDEDNPVKVRPEPRPVPEEILEEHVQAVIDYCYQHHWLDDAKFASRYISGRSNKGYGAQRIRSELLQKGVDKEIISTALEETEVDWCVLARDIAVRKFGENLPKDWKEKSKVLRYLLYRGFFQEEIQSIYRDFDD